MMQPCCLVLATVVSLVCLPYVRAEAGEPSSKGNSLLAPLPDKAPAPEDNPTTAEKAALGKQLFFDPRLSGDNATSCASCHLPDKALTDGRARAQGRNGRTLARNTPSLFNVAFQSSLFWDGRAKTLEEQALVPIQHPQEMNQDLDELERELAAITGYVEQFQDVFGTEVTRDGIAKALAAFERTLITGPAPFDRYLAGERDALSFEARRGLELFVGDADCARCHHGPLLSDGEFYRLGVTSEDKGRAAVTGDAKDRGKFRTPSLRHVAETAPYMHDGSQPTLHRVVEFYLRGAPTTSSGLPLDIEPLLDLSYSDIGSLVAFLDSLTGEPPDVEPPELP